MSMYPWALHRTRRTGQDFPIFYDKLHYREPPGWMYHEATIVPLHIFKGLSYPHALALVTYGTAVACGYMSFKIGEHAGWDQTATWLISAQIAWYGSYPARHGNLAGICAALCFSPVGALIASMFKPHLLVFVLLYVLIGAAHPVLFSLLVIGAGIAFFPSTAKIQRDQKFLAPKYGGKAPGLWRRYIFRKDCLVYLFPLIHIVMEGRLCFLTLFKACV